MKSSIVLSVHNKAHYLDVFLDQLRRSARDAELVAVDDGSTDGTQAILGCYADRLIVTDDIWEVRANNAGIAATTGDWVAIVQDDDFILAADWLDVCVDFMESNGIDILSGRGVGQIGVRCVGSENPPQSSWQIPNKIEALDNIPDPPVIDGGHYVYLHTIAKRFRLPSDNRFESMVTLCPMVIRSPLILSRRALNMVGLFDEGFAPLLYDDLDYCMRANAHGLKVAFTSIPHFSRFAGGSKVLYTDPNKKRLFQEVERRNRHKLLARHKHHFVKPQGISVQNVGILRFDLLPPRFSSCAGFADAYFSAQSWNPLFKAP